MKKPILLLLTICLSVALCYGEGRLFKRVPAIEEQSLNNYTTYDITRTPDGFTWFATDHGLIRFDGQHSILIDIPGNKPGPRSVMAITPLGDNSLIAATTSGIYTITLEQNGYNVKHILDASSFPAARALNIPGKISIIGGDDGLIVFTPSGQNQHVMIGRDMLDLSNKVIDMTLGKDGVYLLTKGGIFRLNPDDLTIIPVLSRTAIDTLGATTIAATDSNIYLGTSGRGIWRYSRTTGNLEEAFTFSKGNVVTDMQISSDGRYLFVGTDGGGITKIDIPTEKIVTNLRHSTTNPESPSSNQVYSLFSDPNGLLWAGYYQNGADYTPAWNGPFELIDDPKIFNTRGVPVRALSLSDDRIIIGTREGLVIFEKNCSTAWTLRNPQLRSEMVISLFDHNGETFIGTYGGGMQILNPATRQLRDTSTDSPNSVFRSGNIFAIAADKDYNIWVGTNQGLFRMTKGGAITRYTSSDSNLPEGNIYGIFFDSEGKGWICTESGLCIYDPHQDKLRTDLFPASFPHKIRYRSVYEDRGHRLYFVPETGKLISSDLDLANLRTFSHPLLDQADAKGVVEDNYGNIWITTNLGIFRVDSHGHTLRFGNAAGLPSPSFLQAQPLSDREGHIWLGNSEGLLRLTEAEIEPSIRSQRLPVPTALKINGIYSSHVPQRNLNDSIFHINLEKASNTLKIDFSPLTYALEEPETYLYSLDGEEWKQFSKQFCVTLYELSPGSHELKVKSANDVEGEEDMTIVRINVPYPVWWYVTGILILAVIICSALVYYQHRRHREKEAMIRSVNPALQISIDKTERQEEAPQEEPAQRTKYASNTLSRNEAREISRKVEEVMEKEKPYLNSELKVGNLAALVGISSHKLSQFFSQYKNQTFYDYINQYRVKEFKRMMKVEKNRSLTLSALAEKAGFSSRASFFRYFKNIEGISPGEWIKNLDKDK